METYDYLETDNPLLDEIVYNCKLIMKSCILKNQDDADKAETLESYKAYTVHKAIITGTAKIYLFDVTESDLRKTLSNYFSDFNLEMMVNRYVDDVRALPETYKNELLNVLTENFENQYEELNEYYRKISGLPPIGDPGIFISDSDVEDTDIFIDTSIPIHKMGLDKRLILKKLGVIDKLIENNPNKYYLRYLTQNINPDVARLLDDHSLLYVEDIEPKLINRFKVLLEKNKIYFVNLLDNQAYKIYNDYYNRFISIIIVSQTIIDMIVEMPDYYIRRDVFDIRTCEYFCEANGVDFFPEIPLKYQIKLVQNLNHLIQYKSTDKCLIDICSLFGFKNIEIFKYYLMKIHKKDSAGEFLSEEDYEDLDKVYDLKFIKVPLKENVDKYYNNPSNYENYDFMTDTDEEWVGPYTKNEVKQNILKQEFNIVRSKYMSIDALYSLTDIAFETSYFLNMILYSGIDPRNAIITFPHIEIDYKVNIFDIFIYLFALSFKYLSPKDGPELVDTILYDPSQILSVQSSRTESETERRGYRVRGFNFDVSMTTLSNYVNEKGFTLEELGVDGFRTRKPGEYYTVGEMINIYVNNKNIYDHIMKQMMHAESKEIFDVYKYLYDAMVISEHHYNLFSVDAPNEDGEIEPRRAYTYTEFLEYNNPLLFRRLNDFYNYKEWEDRSNALYYEMETITQRIIDVIDNENLTRIFSQFPLNIGDYVKQYMYKIINFFKSHKVLIKDLNNLYTLDEEYVYITDQLISNYSTFDQLDKIPIGDIITKLNINCEFKDNLDILYDIVAEMIRVYYIEKDLNINIQEYIASIISYLKEKSDVNIRDIANIVYRHYYREYKLNVFVQDFIKYKFINLEKQDSVSIMDFIELSETHSN